MVPKGRGKEHPCNGEGLSKIRGGVKCKMKTTYFKTKVATITNQRPATSLILHRDEAAAKDFTNHKVIAYHKAAKEPRFQPTSEDEHKALKISA